ncbi:SCO family protein [Variovorax guangxiensis]|uniref:SCO family protein n=1 Tax=Variovorax guangxiensis TaxID=1775474 RepID=UPI002859127B|nr:SCO family protein [Variovorax guangxiensis]MDR6856314.1 protein SCO1/2 [Variovorax guangxiensis]
MNTHRPLAPSRPASHGRRRLLAAGALAWLGALPAARADAAVGPVTPAVTAPALPLRRHDGAAPTLAAQLRGTPTAVQLMFTGCSTVCPIQGALFAALQAALPAERDAAARLLSLSIDPLADDPAALSAWLRRFGAGPAWSAAAPAPAALDPMLSLFRGGVAAGDRHTGQVYVFDRQARLVWRTSELPPAAEVLAALRRVA